MCVCSLSYNAKGTLVINGFLEPEHADVEDIELWYPEVTNKNAGAQFDKDIAKYVISHVLERFNELHEQEMTALSWMTPGSKLLVCFSLFRVVLHDIYASYC